MHVIGIRPPDVFQALADATRLRIVRLIAATKEECCLCELVDSLLEPQYKLSRHVKILRQSGLLSMQKEGRWVYHRLVTGRPYLSRLYTTIRVLPDIDGVFAADRARFLKRMCLREAGRCRVGIQTRELAVGGT
jgi:ArsR family transcriptional regulator